MAWQGRCVVRVPQGRFSGRRSPSTHGSSTHHAGPPGHVRLAEPVPYRPVSDSISHLCLGAPPQSVSRPTYSVFESPGTSSSSSSACVIVLSLFYPRTRTRGSLACPVDHRSHVSAYSTASYTIHRELRRHPHCSHRCHRCPFAMLCQTERP